MGAVAIEAEDDGGFEHMALIAAGGLADDEQGADPLLHVALDLGAQQAVHGSGGVGDAHPPVARQDMEDEFVLGDFDGDNVLEAALAREHRHGVRPAILDCIRPSKGLSTVRMNAASAAGVGDKLRPRRSIPAGTARRPRTGWPSRPWADPFMICSPRDQLFPRYNPRPFLRNYTRPVLPPEGRRA